jgi:ubiquinone/menaquinone biosynthesis C-methylase UbiE
MTETRHRSGPARKAVAISLPYLEDNYGWAYLRPVSPMVFDHTAVVSAILWGCYPRLKRAVLNEVRPGQSVFQAACAYGDLSVELAQHIGSSGHLDIIDIAPLQVANWRRKLARFPQAKVRVADAAAPGNAVYDAVCCFFLLHEMPDNYKTVVIDSLLGRLAVGGKAIFVDYHKSHGLHPLKPVTALIFDLADALWQREIAEFASDGDRFQWRKNSCFGGLYQVTVAERQSAQRGPAATERATPVAGRYRVRSHLLANCIEDCGRSC